MKLISWNVNGIRACIGKGFEESFAALDADIFCLQETKCQQGQVELELPGYHQYWNYANRRGYSGTAVFTKKEPISVAYGLGIEEHDKEGRVITLEFENFYLVTVYTPNSQSELRRLEYRMHWEEDFLAYLLKLQEKKPVICCGDFNVAHKEIDLKNTVIATGGSVVYCDEAMQHYVKNDIVVYIELPYEVIASRLENVKRRGVVLKDGQTLKDLYKERILLYEKYAQITVKAEGLSVEELMDTIAEKVLAYESTH